MIGGTKMPNSRPFIHWNRVINKQEDNYLAWPTIAKADNGELLVVFSGDRETHVCPYGKNQMIRSSDRGETWTDAETINNSPLDDRDTGIVVTRSGTIVITWFTGISYSDPDTYKDLYPKDYKSWIRHWNKISNQDKKQFHGYWSRRSVDQGITWDRQVHTNVTAPHGPIQLKNGSLIMVGSTNEFDGYRIAATKSLDEGRSWHLAGIIPMPEEKLSHSKFFCEPHLCELSDGKIIALIRYEPVSDKQSVEVAITDNETHDPALNEKVYDDWYIHQSESLDGGTTWSSVHKTPILGWPPHLLNLHDDTVLATYGIRTTPYGQRACLSHDGGITWDIRNEIVLRDDAPNGDLGYPATVEIEPGELLTVYYQAEENGEKPCIMATRWSLK